MPADDRDDASTEASRDTGKERIEEALQSETDEPLPPAAEAVAERDADRAEPVTPQGQRRRYLTRRNAFIATIAIAVILVAVVFLALLAYRLGFVDRFVANQIKSTLAEYGVRTEIKDFHVAISPRTVEMRGIDLYDAKTGTKLGQVNRILATVRVEDLYALNLHRDINLESIEVDGAEVWVTFDKDGNSNFRNLSLPPPNPNERILFSYSTAFAKINSAVIHYNDELHNISGEARNIRGTVKPDDLNAPASSWMDTVDLWLSNSTFVYDGRPVNNIDIEAHARINQTRAEIHDLTLRSPLAEAHLQGTMDDWRALRYQMQITSMIDLTQASDVLQTGAALRGVGNLSGTVTGEGTHYQVDGRVTSDALAADNIRLQGLNVSARASGDGKSYDVTGRAVAELLMAGDFKLNAVQLAGNVMGTGTDFRWLGELRAAAIHSGATSITGLILSDARAEMRDNTFTASAPRVSAGSLNASGASVSGGITISDVRVRQENGAATASAASAQAGSVVASGARVNGLTAGGISVVDRGGATNAVVESLRVGGISAVGAQVGSLNIAGVRLAVHNGRVEGSSGDIDTGTVTLAKSKDFAGGRVEGVRLAHPVFVLEPQGSYRASADLSLGGGVLGQVELGAAHAGLVASNNQIQLSNFTADIMGGHASGNATVSTTTRGASHVAASFNDLDIGKLVSLTGRVVPVAGKATGTVDLTFPGTDIAGAATGSLTAQFSGETGSEASGRTPINGEIAMRADRGLFRIDRANLRTAASTLTASGQFSVERDSNLQLALASTDATELQNVLVSSGLFPAVEEQLDKYGIQLAGNLSFNGTVRGKLTDPEINGRASLASLVVNGQNLGSLSASIATDTTQLSVTDGRLTQPDGGGVQFTLNAPRSGQNNITLDATLDRVNGENLVAALSGTLANTSQAGRAGSIDLRSSISGHINVTGLPDAMSGSADLRFGAGSLNGEPFTGIVVRATFSGSNINVENLDARFNAGRITGSGNYNTKSQDFSLQARATGVRLDLLQSLIGNASLPQLSGTADLEARASGNIGDFSTFDINFNGQGQNVTINGRPAGTLSLVGQTVNKQLTVTFTTGLLGQPQVVTARVDLGNPNLPATIETTFSAANLQPLFAAIMPTTANITVTGHATGTVRASGNLRTENAEGEDVFGIGGLRGTANFTDLSVQIQDMQLAATSPLIVQFTPTEITFERTQFTGPGTNVTFGGKAALASGGTSDLTVNGRLNLSVLNSISRNAFLTGTADVAVRVTGTYDQPRINGNASIGANDNGAGAASVALLVSDERITLTNIKTRVIFNSNQAQVESFTGTLGGGHVTASGGVLLERFVPSRFLIDVHGDNVTVPFPEDFRSTADADLEIKGTLSEQIISGVVNLRRAEYTKDIDVATLINRRGEGSLTEGGGGTSPFGTSTELDLRVDGRDALVVRNNIADVVGSVALHITGPVEDPSISGRITATRGTLSFRNDRYDLTRAYVDLPGGPEFDPILNIEAESEIKGYRVIVSLTGPLSQPQATVRSDPALPQADVVSLITTGNLSSGDTGGSVLAQTGLGTAASLLTDTLINAPAQRATSRLFGLNRFEIDPLVTGRGGASPTARLTVGRQINKNLSITYSTNVTSDQNQVVVLEYRLSNRLSFVAQFEQGAVRTLSNRNNIFSFEIRFVKRF